MSNPQNFKFITNFSSGREYSERRYLHYKTNNEPCFSVPTVERVFRVKHTSCHARRCGMSSIPYFTVFRTCFLSSPNLIEFSCNVFNWRTKVRVILTESMTKLLWREKEKIKDLCSLSCNEDNFGSLVYREYTRQLWNERSLIVLSEKLIYAETMRKCASKKI